ncbi:YhgE/Pip domain-containing protein [Rhodococcus qingshengii]|uniref:YhgE/Pip domain-containing protein n=1 Tax=Rhodococcus qingshengii TaxID=334542 RepID=UPI001BEB0E1C|nr:DUF3533 domain-containing protein [Rhodococcus qingshengii]MBT2270086.1 DUF3533 domain-containing protein [Rhodococcus qingshengii]
MAENTARAEERVTALHALRTRKLWIPATVILSGFSFLLSLVYMGAIVNPREAMHELPIAVVNADQGASTSGTQLNLGERIVHSVTEVSDDKIAWTPLSEEQVREQMALGKLYGGLVIPENFTTAVMSLNNPGTAAAVRPSLTVLTNPASGSLASSLAASVTEQAAHSASSALSEELVSANRQQSVQGRDLLLLQDPVSIHKETGYDLGDNSGLGMTAFFYVLLLVMCGFMGANVLTNFVDAGLGFIPSDFGPWRSHRPLLQIGRRHTLITAWGLMVALAVPMASLVMIACVTVLGMDASHLLMLWLFSYCAVVAVGLSCLTILSIFGTPGMLVATFVFIALAIPSSNGTIPLEAVPPFYRFLATFEPMRQLTDGIRAILYFDARADAGLAHAWMMVGIGAATALALGYAVNRAYERKGWSRHSEKHTDMGKATNSVTTP